MHAWGADAVSFTRSWAPSSDRGDPIQGRTAWGVTTFGPEVFVRLLV